MISRNQASPPDPIWWTLPGLIFQSAGMFILPFAVGLSTAMFFEVAEVADTLPVMLAFTVVILFPISLAQVLGVILKSRREYRYWRDRKGLTVTRFFDVLFRHMRVVTVRGWSLLGAALLFTVFALAFKWASFGLIAVLGLFLFYVVTGWTIFLSTFLVRTFEKGIGRNPGGVTRQVIPAVVVAGESAEEVFTFRQVPVPMGYTLLVEDPLPFRLKTESRYMVGSVANRGEVEVRGRLRVTPRGYYRLGPAQLWYQDLLGITRVSVASVATAAVKVLPRFRPVQIIEPPKSKSDRPDVITKPHRFPTEDFFRFREYAAGDDTRRIHWRLSLKSGCLQVRQPENREISTKDVFLVLDSYLPRGKLLMSSHGADQILDRLVDVWLGLAKELVDRGDRVTLVAALIDHEGSKIAVERHPCRKGEAAKWQDMGARVCWQGHSDVPALLAECGDEVHGVVVTARFTTPPPGPLPGQDMTWLFLDPGKALGRDDHWFTQVMGGSGFLRLVNWAIRLPNPAGSEDNALYRRLKEAWRLRQLWRARWDLRLSAKRRGGRTLKELLARGDAVYRVEQTPTLIRLVGLQGHTGSSRPA